MYYNTARLPGVRVLKRFIAVSANAASRLSIYGHNDTPPWTLRRLAFEIFIPTNSSGASKV